MTAPPPDRSATAPPGTRPPATRDPAPPRSAGGPSPFAILVSGLGAAAAAVVSSYFGVAGTVLGAAVGSVVAATVNTLYAHAARRAAARMATLQTRPLGRLRGTTIVLPPTPGDTVVVLPDAAGDAGGPAGSRPVATGSTSAAAADPAGGTGWRHRLAALNWRRVLLLAAGLFLVVAVVLTAVELISGRPISALLGRNDDRGTSFSRVVHPHRASSPGPSTGTPTPTPGGSATGGGSASASATPSTVPSPSPSPSASAAPAPSPTTGASPTASPSADVGATPTPTGPAGADQGLQPTG